MRKQYFPCINDSLYEVPYLKRCEYKKKSDVVVDEVDKSESTLDDDIDSGVVSLDPENVKKYGKSVEAGKKVNVISLLSSPKSGRDFLVNSGGEQVKVNSIIGKYMLIYCFKLPVESDSKDGLVCWALKRAILHWPNFQLVVVTKMDSNYYKNTDTNTKIREREALFNTFVAAFPNCLAIPISDSHSYKRISGFVGWASCMLLDPNGIVVSKNRNAIMKYGAAAFPFTNDHYDTLHETTVWKWLNERPVPLENLLGLGLSDFLSNSDGKTIAVSDLKHKLVGLYLYRSGNLMVAIDRAYQCCRANNLVLDIVLVYLPVSDDPLHFKTCAHAALRNKGISSSSHWWVLPFDDSTSRRLWMLCECSRKDELIIVGPQGKFLDSFAANIVTVSDSRSVLNDMYPYAAEAIAREETDRLNKLTVASLFPKKKCRLLTQKGHRKSLKRLRGKIVCVFIANCDSSETLETIRSWCHENENDSCKCTNVALVLVPFHSSKSNFNPNSSPNNLSWLWDSKMPWLICPDPVLHASIIKHTTLRGLRCPKLSNFTFGEDGKLLSTARPSLSQIQANCFPKYELHELVLECYTEGFECERDVYDCY